MKILLTGAKGMLGSDLCLALSKNHDVTAVDLEDFDISIYNDAASSVSGSKADLVIHSAAYTDVDGCELNPEKAFMINALGTQNLVLACREKNIPLAYISTDYVFDGTSKIPYLESDKTNPLSIYGKSKLAGEEAVRNHLDKFFIIRTSWLFGVRGKNFISTIQNLAARQKEIRIVNDQTGSPTFTKDLAEGIKELIESPYYGIYHITNQGACSWFEFAKIILEYSGLKDVSLNPISTEELKRFAPRPGFSVLDNNFYRLRGFKMLRNFKEALSEYLRLKDEIKA